jgi:hypothetical protein
MYASPALVSLYFICFVSIFVALPMCNYFVIQYIIEIFVKLLVLRGRFLSNGFPNFRTPENYT